MRRNQVIKIAVHDIAKKLECVLNVTFVLLLIAALTAGGPADHASQDLMHRHDVDSRRLVLQ